MTGAIARVLRGWVRSTAFALCALIVPAAVALLPTLAALGIVGSPWSWTNPWSWVGLAIIGAAATLALAHPVATLFRSLIERWTGVRTGAGFRERPEPVQLATGFWWNGSSYERTREDAVASLRIQLLREPAYWREVRWVVTAAVVVAPVCATAPAALVAGIVLLTHGSATAAAWAVASFVAAGVCGTWAWRTLPPAASRWLAAPSGSSRTAAELRAQRADLTAAHDAEIRRIERDLHDGAQSRLVAVGLDLATAERLVERDPARATELLRAARAGTAASLNELRELVRGVYPPVLVERGLVPAIRALALDSPVAVEVDGPDELRLPSPLAAAVYFSVSELLTNTTKHAHATLVQVAITCTAGNVVAVVRDDGRGGASLLPGGGLDGVRRRLDAFDATLAVDSPVGGPTEMTVRMPCESS